MNTRNPSLNHKSETLYSKSNKDGGLVFYSSGKKREANTQHAAPHLWLLFFLNSSIVVFLVLTMGFYIEESIIGFTIGQAIYEAALVIAVLRWVFCWVFRMIKDRRDHSLETSIELSSSWLSSQMIRDSTLMLTTFGEIAERTPKTEDTCAVCLSQLRMEDEVSELMNCCHVFHRECIDRWLDHDHEYHNPTCPLCRAPLLAACASAESSNCLSAPPQPSWAVERLLYLSGDDLLP